MGGGARGKFMWGRMILCPAPPDHGKKIPNLGSHGAHGAPYGAHGAPWGTHGAHGPPNCKFSFPPGTGAPWAPPGAPWAPGALGFGAHGLWGPWAQGPRAPGGPMGPQGPKLYSILLNFFFQKLSSIFAFVGVDASI